MALKMWTPGNPWPFTGILDSLPKSTQHFLAGFLFRYKVLMPLQSILLLLIPYRPMAVTGAVILILGLWIEIARILVDRFVFGVHDSNFRSELAKKLLLQGIQIPKTETPTQRLRRFMYITFGLAWIVTFSYVGIYSTIDAPGEPSSFQNVKNNWQKPINLMYFSITTIATVGYGDICPTPNGERVILTRVLVGSQIVAGFLVLSVLVVSISLTFQHEGHKVLLRPRAEVAYGQDFLIDTLARDFRLKLLRAGDSGYGKQATNFDLVISMNLDGKADSDYVLNLPANIPVVAHVHCRPSYYSPEQMHHLSSALERVSVGIVPALFLQRELQARYPNVDWRLVYNGVDRNRFRVAEDKERKVLRQKHGIKDDLKLVAFVGRLERAKGLQILQEFCRQIAGTRLALLIQFPSNTAKTIELYSETATALRDICPERIFIHRDEDYNSDRPVRHADILLTTSLSEVCPLVVLEAFMAGIPVVGTHATPFYDELSQLGIPVNSFRFVPLPKEGNFEVERSKLTVDQPAAKTIAEQLIKIAAQWPHSSTEEKHSLSRAAYAAGFDQQTMSDLFQRIYSAACI